MAKFYSKEEINKFRNFFEEYLQLKGINTKKLFRCISPTHEDKNPSMAFFNKSNTCYCFGCRKSYDIFKFIGLEYGLENFIDQVKKIDELYKNKELILKDNINDTIYAKKNVTVQLDDLNTIKNTASMKKSGFSNERSYREYVYKCFKNNKNTNYLTDIRKIPQNIIDKYYIGFDNKFRVKDFKTREEKFWKAIIIPTDMGSLIVRNTDLNAEDRLRKVGTGAIFNYWELKANFNKPYYVVEGEIDCLTLIAAKRNCVALGSLTQINKFVKKLKEDNLNPTLYLMLDNDRQGIAGQNYLYDELKKNGINSIKTDVLQRNNFKDPNDFWKAAPEKFISELDLIENKLTQNPWDQKLAAEKKTLVRD